MCRIIFKICRSLVFTVRDATTSKLYLELRRFERTKRTSRRIIFARNVEILVVFVRQFCPYQSTVVLHAITVTTTQPNPTIESKYE
jgi:ribosomal protein S12